MGNDSRKNETNQYISIMRYFLYAMLPGCSGNIWITALFPTHFSTKDMKSFNKSLNTSNILARIPIKSSYFSIIMENDFNIITEPRKYFGPVDIYKLRVQLIQENGFVLAMNNTNYSFCINFKMLYDI